LNDDRVVQLIKMGFQFGAWAWVVCVSIWILPVKAIFMKKSECAFTDQFYILEVKVIRVLHSWYTIIQKK
jgi:hypothetical protein